MAELPVEGGRGIRMPHNSSVPATDVGIIGPSAEEADDVNSGREQYKGLVGISGSTAAKGAAGIAAVAVGSTVALEAGHRINEDIPNVPVIVRSVQEFRNSISPSGGTEFHPNALGGEVTPANTINVSLEEALAQTEQKTEEEKKLFFFLPKNNPENGALQYKVKEEMTGIKNIEEGSKIQSPYEGELWWETYENNPVLVINITKINPQEADDEGKTLQYIIANGKLLLEEDFNTSKQGPEGSATIISSRVKIEKGQSIFEITGKDTVQGSYQEELGDYQMIVRWADILATDDKAVAVN